MLKFMLNVIEDCRVDSIVGKEMPGASINLDELHESSSKSMLKNIESIESLENNSIDFYASVKSLYLQNRAQKIANSEGAAKSQDDSDWEEIDNQ